jgi:hypothetical protein
MVQAIPATLPRNIPAGKHRKITLFRLRMRVFSADCKKDTDPPHQPQAKNQQTIPRSAR